MPRSSQTSAPSKRKSLSPVGRRTRSARKKRQSDAPKPDIDVNVDASTPQLAETPVDVGTEAVAQGTTERSDTTTTDDTPVTEKINTSSAKVSASATKAVKSARKKAPLPPLPATPLPPLPPSGRANRSTKKKTVTIHQDEVTEEVTIEDIATAVPVVEAQAAVEEEVQQQQDVVSTPKAASAKKQKQSAKKNAAVAVAAAENLDVDVISTPKAASAKKQKQSAKKNVTVNVAAENMDVDVISTPKASSAKKQKQSAKKLAAAAVAAECMDVDVITTPKAAPSAKKQKQSAKKLAAAAVAAARQSARKRKSEEANDSYGANASAMEVEPSVAVASPAPTPVAPVSAKKTKTARAQTPKKKSEKTPAPPTPTPTPTLAPTLSKSEPQMAVIVHRFRNANYIPRGILRLCSTPYSPETNDCPQLAVSREGGAVELVSVNEKWKCVGMVEGMKNRSVDAMAWVCGEDTDKSGNGDDFQLQLQDESDQKAKEEVYFNRQHQLAAQVQQKRRLFGASRDGTIFELDFKTKKHSGVIGSGGGAVFCLQSLCPGNLIAAGCEDGSVRIYRAAAAASSNVDSNKACLELVSTLPSVGGAVISIAWLPGSGESGMEGSIMYAGAADGTIRKFQCTSALHMARQSGSAPHAISTGAVLNNDNDFKMAGDSRLSSLQWKAGLRMTVENRGRRSATKIWTLSVLKDGTVVSGDSMGNVQFWDGNAGTLLQSFEHNSNNGDVLDLAVSYDQNKVMASGVDSRVICMERIPSTSCSESKWVLTNQQRSHTHDVNSLAMVYISDSSGSLGSKKKRRELLCSGGVDTKVCSYFVSNMKKYRAKIAYKYPTKAPIALSKGPRILSIMRQDKVDFFQLAKVNTDVENASNTALNEEEAYLGSVGIASNHNLVAFDVSEDGKFLAVSHTAGLLLFALNFVEGASEEDGGSSTVLVPKKLIIPTDADVACSALKFGTDFLICATTNGPINLVRLDSGSDGNSATLERSFDQNSDKAFACESYPITELTLSADKRWFAASRNALGKGSLQVFSLPKHQLWWTLPCTEAPHSCIKFLGEDGDVAPALAVACNNGVVYLFDVEQKCLSDWSDDLGFPAGPNLPKELGSCSHCPETLAYNTATPNKFVMVSYFMSALLNHEKCTALCLRATYHELQVCHLCQINLVESFF